MSGNITQMAAFANELEKIAQNDESLFVMTADLVGSCSLNSFEKNFKDQFVNVGIAEQNMIGIAAGLAKEGIKPYAYTFAVFNSLRACEQIRTDVFYNDLNVKIIATHCGVSTGQAGSTHFSVEDIGVIRSMPKSVILIPSDAVSAKKTARLLHSYTKPAYVRLDRNPIEDIYDENTEFEVGKSHILKDGNDIVIYAVGVAVADAVEAAKKIESETGKSVAVIDIFSVKPIDEDTVLKYAKKCEIGFVVEEHNVHCGLYGAIAEVVCKEDVKCKLFPIGIDECYPRGNTVERSREILGLDAEGICNTVLKKII